MGGDEHTVPLLPGPAGKKLDDFTHFVTQLIARPKTITRLAKVPHLIIFCETKINENKTNKQKDQTRLL